MTLDQKRTKIVCTIGPASANAQTLLKMVEAGMNVCRLNFSHGTHEDHAKLIKTIRTVSEKTGQPLTILQDLQGPKIRVGELPAEGIKLVTGGEISFTAGKGRLPYVVPVSYPNLAKDVKPGQSLLLDDGLISVRVKAIRGQEVLCQVIFGGTLFSHKGLNLPDTKTTISAMSEKDREDVEFGVQQGVDYIALSFVREAGDLEELRHLVTRLDHRRQIPIRLIAKIEKPEAITNLDAIIEATDGIMVARGDLGIEMPAEKVPIIQKDLIARCLDAAKPVIVATQMLDSMIRQPRATRAEISDVANAAIDHTDATMLSGESATGAFPIEAVEVMAKTVREIELSVLDDLPPHLQLRTDHPEAMITNVASILSHASQAKVIICFSPSGNSVRWLSRHRPPMPIIAITSDERVLRQMNLSWGVLPVLVPMEKEPALWEKKAIAVLKKRGFLKAEDQVIVVMGEPVSKTGNIQLIETRTI